MRIVRSIGSLLLAASFAQARVGVTITIRRGKVRAEALTQLAYEPFMPLDKNSKTSRAFACHSSPPGKSPKGSWRVMIMGFSESPRRTSTRSSEFLIST